MKPCCTLSIFSAPRQGTKLVSFFLLLGFLILIFTTHDSKEFCVVSPKVQLISGKDMSYDLDVYIDSRVVLHRIVKG